MLKMMTVRQRIKQGNKMSVPTHGEFCSTWMYPRNCWYCGCSIYILQCSCGSTVLLDTPRPPWEKHDCGSGGIGGSGYSGWIAIDQLRAEGVPITNSIMKQVFNDLRKSLKNNKKPDPDIEKAHPYENQKVQFLGIVREKNRKTKLIDKMNALSDMAHKIITLPMGKKIQFTIHDNGGKIHKSYTCLALEKTIPSGIKVGIIVKITLRPCFSKGLPDSDSVWFVEEIGLL